MKEDDYFFYTISGKRVYKGVELKIQLGQPLNANFNLAINTFKSQQGDINVAAPDASTVAVEGTYADGTEFSFDLCTK